jgi:hypothetical protein
MHIKLTKEKLLKLLGQNKWEKQAVGEALGTSEASIRRACMKFKIDTDEERKKALGAAEPQTFKIVKPTSNSDIQKGSFIVVSDGHGKDYDRPTVAAICAFAKDFKPEYFIFAGDLIDNTPLLSKVKMKYPALDAQDMKELDTDYFYANEILNQIDLAVPKATKKVFLVGNHEVRSDYILKAYPEFNKVLNYKERLNLKERGWDASRAYLEPIKLGKINIFHGEFWGIGHLKKHLTHYQKNVMYGHTHQVCQDTLASPMREIPIWAASIGCVCNVAPDWQRGKSNAWQHGFSYGWFDEQSGDFDPVIKRIIHGQFHAEGKVYSGENK